MSNPYAELVQGLGEPFRSVLLDHIAPASMCPALRVLSYDVAAPLKASPGLAGTTKAHADEVRGAFRFYFGHELAFVPRNSLAIDVFESLPAPLAVAVYWAELDELRRQIKALAFFMTARRLREAVEAIGDPERAYGALRKVLEVTWWSVYATYGAQLAYTQVAKAVETQRAAMITSKDTDEFIRGFFATDEARVHAAFRAVDEIATYKSPSTFVEENAAVVRKQRAVARFFAEVTSRRIGTDLVRPVDRTIEAYEYLCGWVHVTPVLLNSVMREIAAPLTPENDLVGEIDPGPGVPALIRTIAVSTWKIQNALLFNDEWKGHAFQGIVMRACDWRAKRALDIGVPLLQELRHPHKPVEVLLADGTLVAPFPKERRKPALRPPER